MTIEKLQQDWDSYVSGQTAAKAAVDAKRETIEAQIKAFEDDRSPGFLNSLRRVFNGIAVMPFKRGKVRRLNEDAADIVDDIRAEAAHTFDKLGQHAVASSAAGAPLIAQHSRLSKLLEQVSLTQDEVDEAADACRSASSMEMMDAFSKNKGVSIMSHIETDEAAQELREACHALKKLKAQLAAAPELEGGIAGDIESDNDFDFIMDMINYTMGNFTSISNMGKLDNAADNMDDMLQQLGRVEEKLERDLRGVSHAAITIACKSDAAAQKLMDSLQPHLKVNMTLSPNIDGPRI